MPGRSARSARRIPLRDGSAQTRLRSSESDPLPLIVPAFTERSSALVQNRIKRRAHEQGLLPWLNDCVWPEESRFADSAYAKASATEFSRTRRATARSSSGVLIDPRNGARSIHPAVRPFHRRQRVDDGKLARRADTICQRGACHHRTMGCERKSTYAVSPGLRHLFF